MLHLDAKHTLLESLQIRIDKSTDILFGNQSLADISHTL